MNKDIWYALTEDFNLIQFEEPKQNSRYSHWMKEITIGSNTTTWGNTYDVSEYKFYDSSVNNIEYEIDGWRIIKAYDPSNLT